jgi:acyl carrier protein
MNNQLPTEFTNENLSDWLVDKVAFYLQKSTSEIKTDQPLSGYGLDSVYAVSLCGDLEDILGIYVEPTLAWDYPTIDEIVNFLRQELDTIAA